MLTLKFVSIDFIVTLDILDVDETKYYLDFYLILYPMPTVATYLVTQLD